MAGEFQFCNYLSFQDLCILTASVLSTEAVKLGKGRLVR